MSSKKKFLIIWVMSILLLSVFIYFINSINSIKNSPYIKITSTKTIKNNERQNISYSSFSSNTIINNLTSVKNYISDDVITKQNILLKSIVGGDYNHKHYKKSQIAWFNNSTGIGINRYTKQAKAIINNSNECLKLENKEIKKIIIAVKIHPYTFSFYLNKNNTIIPNINFFIQNNNSNNYTILNSKFSNIHNSTYELNINNPNINKISETSEENTIGAQNIKLIGSGLLKVVFQNINFKAKIITFNFSENRYQFANIASSSNSQYYNNLKSLKKNKLIDKLSDISKATIFTYNNSSLSNTLTSLVSFNNEIKNTSNHSEYSLNDNYLNKYSIDFGNANINYNHIRQFKYNKNLYYAIIFAITWPIIVLPIVSTPISISLVIHETVITIKKINKIRKEQKNTIISDIERIRIEKEQIIEDIRSISNKNSLLEIKILNRKITKKIKKLQKRTEKYKGNKDFKTKNKNEVENIKKWHDIQTEKRISEITQSSITNNPSTKGKTNSKKTKISIQREQEQEDIEYIHYEYNSIRNKIKDIENAKDEATIRAIEISILDDIEKINVIKTRKGVSEELIYGINEEINSIKETLTYWKNKKLPEIREAKKKEIAESKFKDLFGEINKEKDGQTVAIKNRINDINTNIDELKNFLTGVIGPEDKIVNKRRQILENLDKIIRIQELASIEHDERMGILKDIQNAKIKLHDEELRLLKIIRQQRLQELIDMSRKYSTPKNSITIGISQHNPVNVKTGKVKEKTKKEIQEDRFSLEEPECIAYLKDMPLEIF